MNIHKEPKAENSAQTQASVKYFAKCRNKWDGEVARGAGFEPARPIRTTGLAGLGSFRSVDDLPPTRLGQPRTASSVQ